VDLDRAGITGGTFGFTNKEATYPYRLFLADTDITLAGFSSGAPNGTASPASRWFMTARPPSTRGSGGGAGQPGSRSEFGSRTCTCTMNDLLRDTGGFDVASGEFSVYSDFTVRNGRIDGT
jgi:hypothetical protein